MIVFVTSAISVLLLTIICYKAFKDASVTDRPGDRVFYALYGSGILSLCIGLVTGSMSGGILMVELVFNLVGMLLLQSSLWDREVIRPTVLVFAALQIAPVIMHALTVFGRAIFPDSRLLLLLYLVPVLVLSCFFLIGLWRRLRDVKSTIKAGTVWVNVCLAVDTAYYVIFLTLSACYMTSALLCPSGWDDWLLVFPFMLGLMVAALGIRETDDVLFVFWRRQERRIIESMKITKVETAVDPCSIDNVYQDIYERVVAYFDAEKPFLDNELTINDLVKVLYSNKLYISRAISQFTGRNFCQFVNYYRVAHSLEMFRNNTDLKIHDLASGSGFNSDVSYNMAFRLFMGETPGEWCKKERRRKIKMKK